MSDAPTRFLLGLIAGLLVAIAVGMGVMLHVLSESRDDLNYLVHLQCPSGVSLSTCRSWAQR